ncbi:MAG: ribosomal L7Ae/L30e/S12e/Gadd45 family protein [Oscillibacter sp.]|nr:ribosomal L7Ae/L30e/S12e/Gadd45 family protein [Oscillibacter sp.]
MEREREPLSELSAVERAVGAKQVRRAVQDRRAVRVYLACDADPAVTEPLEALSREYGVPVETAYTMRQIGKACGIAVGASAAAALE